MVEIAGRPIGLDHPPLIIAEMSGNHDQSLDRALQLVEAAAASGADAIKLQTYTADTMTLDVDLPGFVIEDPGSLWTGERLYTLYQRAHTPWEWHAPLFTRARELGLLAFSSAFDATAVDFLETLEVPCYKIASFENVDLRLVERAAATGKPLIISTGMATPAELDDCVWAARRGGCEQLVLLKCTSTYPASPAASNLRTIAHLRDLHGCEVGLSDHTLGIGVAIAGVALGASVIEKHLTLSREDGAVDSAFSLEPADLARLVEETRRAWEALGSVRYGPSTEEESSRIFRRSLYVTRDLEAGDPLTEENLRSIRPGFGLSPRYYTQVLGRRLRRAAPRGTPLTWDLL